MAVISTPDNIFHQLSGELHALRLLFYPAFSLIVTDLLCSQLQIEKLGWLRQRRRLAAELDYHCLLYHRAYDCPVSSQPIGRHLDGRVTCCGCLASVWRPAGTTVSCAPLHYAKNYCTFPS